VIYFIVTVLTMLMKQLLWSSFGIKLHLKQKCSNDSYISFWVGKQAGDLSGFTNLKKIPIKSGVKSQTFELDLYSSNRISICAQIAI